MHPEHQNIIFFGLHSGGGFREEHAGPNTALTILTSSEELDRSEGLLSHS
jgi:hypothetical protein